MTNKNISDIATFLPVVFGAVDEQLAPCIVVHI